MKRTLSVFVGVGALVLFASQQHFVEAQGRGGNTAAQTAAAEARAKQEALEKATPQLQFTEEILPLVMPDHTMGETEGVMKIDPAYCTEWEFIPHFYYGFYVWQYATSMAGAAQFTDAIEHEGAPARDRYINMLKAGGSDYAYELYKKAGIDMATPAPYQALVARMNRILDQIDALEAQK